MIRSQRLLFLLVAVSMSRALPMGCSEDDHCPSGFYCELSSLFCQKCVSCQVLKRLPPSVETPCVPNVDDCGPCYKGLLPRGVDCVQQTARPGVLQLPPYAWAGIALGMLALGLLVCAAAVYVLRNFRTFKIHAWSTRTTVHSPQKPPEPSSPPPYDAVAGNTHPSPETMALEELSPFISPPLARESSSLQTACLSSPPDYSDATDSFDDADNTSGLTTRHDPQPAIDDTTSVPAVVVDCATPRETSPPAKSQDSNNNSEPRDGSKSTTAGPRPHVEYAVPYIINVIKNINSNHHLCEVSLHDY